MPVLPGNSRSIAQKSGEIWTAQADLQPIHHKSDRLLDQFILRFTKLQDAMGGRLFPAILQYLQEQYEERPMLDKLNRLEKLGYIQSAEAWQNIRNARNKFAHDYPDDWEKNAALINVACEAAADMHNILAGIEKKLKIDQPLLELGKALTVCFRAGGGAPTGCG